jgi:hypothetical protein
MRPDRPLWWLTYATELHQRISIELSVDDPHAGIFERPVADGGHLAPELRVLDLRHAAELWLRPLGFQVSDGDPVAGPQAFAQVTVAGALADLYSTMLRMPHNRPWAASTEDVFRVTGSLWPHSSAIE